MRLDTSFYIKKYIIYSVLIFLKNENKFFLEDD